MRVNLLPIVILMASLCVSCGSHTSTRQDRPDRVAVEFLIESHRSSNPPYRNRIIECRLKPGTWKYTKTGSVILIWCGSDDVVQFRLAPLSGTAPAEASEIIVTGLCSGVVHDGTIRCNDPKMDWYICVDACTVSSITP